MKKNKDAELLSSKKRLLFALLFIIIAVCSILSIMAFNKSFSIKTFITFIVSSNPIFIILASICVILFIVFQGLSITTLCDALGHKSKKKDGFFYSCAEIYFSAITPSATGGQPASAYFMLKDGASIPVVTASLLYTMLMYCLSMLIINIVTFIINPNIFLSLDFVAKAFVLVGVVVHIGLIIFYYFVLYHDKILYKICQFFLNIGAKVHLVKDKSEKLSQLTELAAKYREATNLLKQKKGSLLLSFLFNFLQRVSQILVVVFVFLATSGSIGNVFTIWSIESLAIIGSYCVPIPGSIGVTDYLMLNGFKKIMSESSAVNLELLGRGLSFYGCIIISGLGVIIKYALVKKGKKHD